MTIMHNHTQPYIVPKCMSCHKSIVVMIGRAHCFHDCMYIYNICINIYIYACIYTCIYTYIYKFVCIYVCMFSRQKKITILCDTLYISGIHH